MTLTMDKKERSYINGHAFGGIRVIFLSITTSSKTKLNKSNQSHDIIKNS